MNTRQCAMFSDENIKKKEFPEYITFLNKKYILDYERIRDISLSSSMDGGQKELEISQAYEVEDTGELSLTSKVERETKLTGNAQNDMIMYDILKLLIVALLDNNQNELGFQHTFSNVIAINTLLNWGVLIEVE